MIVETLPEKRLLKVQEAAQRVGVCSELIRREIRESRLPAVRVGRLVFVSPAALEKWITERTS